MSRKVIINGIVIFEPEMKRISSEKGMYTLSASAALCFELLIDNIGSLVTHNQLYEYAWRRFGMEPTSTSLYQNISTLRKSLSKAGIENDIIRTMSRRGFLLSPLTDIKWSGQESVVLDMINDNEIATVNSCSKKPLSNELSFIETEDSKEHFSKKIINCKYFKYKASALLGCFIGVLSHIIINNNNRFFFVSKPFYYNGCSIFPNIDGDIKSLELYNIMDVFKIRCKRKEVLYFTGYKYSDRLSFIFCPSQIGEGNGALCHSNYYIYNIKK